MNPKTNEAFVADGYGNRRVIVFDADTGAFKRMWGAFGNPPDTDAPAGAVLRQLRPRSTLKDRARRALATLFMPSRFRTTGSFTLPIDRTAACRCSRLKENM